MWPTKEDTKLDEFDAMDLPGQQLPASHAMTPLDHVLHLDIDAPPACLRLTNIAVTMGKSTTDPKVLMKLFAAGMNIAVLNMNFGTRDEHADMIRLLRKLAKEYSTQMERVFPLAIAVRLSGRKIRTGRISETYGDSVELKAGEIVRLTTDETYRERCSMYTVYIDFLKFPDHLKKNDIIFLDNEKIMCKVDIVSTSTLTCKIERGGELGSYKDVFVPHVVFEMPVFSDKDRKDIELCVHHQVDIVIASFVQSVKCIEELRQLLGDKGKKMSIMSNIETYNGFNNYDKILEAADGILITRQELGSDISPKKIVIAQKNLIARANRANVPVFLNAHLMYSMRFNEIPTRGELLDIANSILDGVDGLMLSPETAVGNFPVETVENLSIACKEAEACIWTKQLYHDLIDVTVMPCDQATGTALAAVIAAQRTIAAAIVVVTSTGKSARLVSKYKPRCPILALTRYAPIARNLHMWRGVLPIIYEANPDPDWQVDLEKRVNYCTKWGIDRGFIRVGDPVVIVSGWQQGSGFTNTMRIIYASAENAAL